MGNEGVDVVPEESPTGASYSQDPFLDISDFFFRPWALKLSNCKMMHDFSSLITMIYAWPTGFRLQVFRALICRIHLVSLLSYFQSFNPESLS